MSNTAKISRGFTMIELMVVLSIMAVLMALAAPSFKDASLASQLRSQANELVAAAALARSEAIKRNTVVTLCASADQTSCATSGGWEQGWIVLQGANLLQSQVAAPNGYRITASGGLTSLTFQPIGAGTTPATLTVCRKTPTVGRQERVVDIDATGRAWVSTTSAGTCA